MRVALISPRGAERNQQNSVLNEIYRKLQNVVSFIEIDDIEFIPNLGLLSIAAFFPKDWEVEYVEEDYIDPSTADRVLYDEHYDLVCLTAVNNQAFRAYQIADTFRARGIPVVMGGFHASALPREAKIHCDHVIVGEGEDVFPQFLRDFQAGKAKPIYYSSNKVDLATLPPPRYDIVRNITRFNKLSLFTTRGCPHRCAYCCLVTTYGPKYRHKTVEQVVREVEMLKEIYPNPYISFSDENMLIDRKWARELLAALAPLNIRWECYSDVGIADDPELLDMLRDANCVELLIGFETVEPESMRQIDPWKYKRLTSYHAAMEAIQSRGIGVMGLFMLGFDHDTPETFVRLRDFIRDTNMFDVDFAILCPIPGTPMFDRYRREGRIQDENWDHYTWYHVNYKPKNLTPEQLREGIMWLFAEFNSVEQIARRKAYFRDVYKRLYGERSNGKPSFQEKMVQKSLAHYLRDDVKMPRAGNPCGMARV